MHYIFQWMFVPEKKKKMERTLSASINLKKPLLEFLNADKSRKLSMNK